MKIEIKETHKGVIIENPTYTVKGTFDDPNSETFTPSIIVTDGKLTNIYHQLPPQPYVNETWTDEDVVNAIENHLKTLKVD